MDDTSTKLIITRLEEVHTDVKECREKLNEIEKLDAVQNQQLAEHMRRTEASEKRLDKVEEFKWYFAGISAIILGIAEFLRRLI